jgi:hypothetical protein
MGFSNQLASMIFAKKRRSSGLTWRSFAKRSETCRAAWTCFVERSETCRAAWTCFVERSETCRAAWTCFVKRPPAKCMRELSSDLSWDCLNDESPSLRQDLSLDNHA